MFLSPPRHRRSGSELDQQGFSLLEVLIAMVVLSVGLLGLAALQMNALRFNQVAHFRTQASFLAYQVLDSMRANPQATSDGDFDITLTAVPGGTGVAAEQLTFWKQQLTAQLPSGNGAVCRSSNPSPATPCTGGGPFVIITIQWQEAGADDETGSARADRSFQLVSQVSAS